MEIRIDKEFKELCRSLTAEERSGLEEQLMKDGCLDPLKLWEGTLIDGHNRYEICTKHGLRFKTEDIALDGRDEAINWIINNQLGRRNLTTEERTYLIGRRYTQEKKMVGEHNGNQYKMEMSENTTIPKGGTAGKVAKETGVDRSTVFQYEKFSKAVDKIAEVVPGAKQKILSGELKATKKSVIELAEGSNESIKEVMGEGKTELKKAEQKKKKEVIEESVYARNNRLRHDSVTLTISKNSIYSVSVEGKEEDVIEAIESLFESGRLKKIIFEEVRI